MKLLVVGLTLLFVCYSRQDAEDDKFDEITEKCVKESGIDMSVIHQDDTYEKNKDNQQFKCFLKCVLVAYNTMTPDGELMVENYKNQHLDLTPEEWGKIVDKCKDIKGKDACDTAYLVTVCVDEDEKYF